MSRDEYTVAAAAMNGRPQRLVTVDRKDGTAFRDQVNPNSSRSRKSFISVAANKFQVDLQEFNWLDDAIIFAADEADARADVEVESDSVETEERKSQATLLVELARDVELFHDPDGNAFARFAVDDHLEVTALRNKRFKTWLAHIFYLDAGKTPSSQAMQDAIGVLEGKAIFEGTTRTVHVRVAGLEGKIYIDLCNEAWQVIEVSATGWRLIDETPVMFRRAKAMLPLPTPVPGGTIGELRRFVHMEDSDWVLFKAWLVGALKPYGPYAVLDLQGEHGSGKSTACRIARALIDPNRAMLRSEPREPRDLMIAANNDWVLAFDNLSGVLVWQSDCLCRLSTGGGFSTRTLYENDEETIFDAQRPVIINGIEEVATRSDLLDRCLLLNLPRMEQSQRRPESELWAEFEEARPRILGALLSAVVVALRNASSVRLAAPPRMADFATWIAAAEAGLEIAPGQFLQAYEANRAAGNDTALDASPVGKLVLEFVDEIRSWSGTATELLQELESRAGDKTLRLKTWPSNARSLGGQLKRIAPNLRAAGIGVEFERVGKGRARLIKLQSTQDNPGNAASALSASSATQKSSANRRNWADGEADANSMADANDFQADVSPQGSSSAENAENPDENCMADKADEADAKIPTESYESGWIQV